MNTSIRLTLALLLTCTVLTSSMPAWAVEVFTHEGNGLDAQAQEIADGAGGIVSYGFNGTGAATNARYNGYNDGFPAGDVQGDADNDDRNEFWVLRFDLSTQEKAGITGAELKFTSHRDLDPKGLRIWGVPSGTAGLNTLDESTAVFSDVPGLFEDDDMTTLSVDDSIVSYLGDFQFAQINMANPIEGDLLRLNQDLINNSGPNGTSQPSGGVGVQNTLDGYLRSLGPTDMAMFLVGGIASNGQVRVTTKEATTTDTGLYSCGVDFDCAPSLEFEISETTPGDQDGDGDVDGADIRLAQLVADPAAAVALSEQHFGTESMNLVANAIAVPEPSSALLALAGCAWLAAARRQNR